jgi:isocitrate/isopropylmalate dehydrogenase
MESLYGYGDFKHPTYLPRPGAGKNKVVGLIPGSGIGEMLIDSVLQIFNHVDIRMTYQNYEKVNSKDKEVIDRLSK